ncbi:hypothetical protein JYB87_14715 [Shewanella avicenniae]|uniref:Lipoprotein n=1 Tax=Shewanella avicenniae TaxID=2814294 RepID=A0ABX7QQI5_9GAMM|nr:hypothetical protein [Shewanella avicenniae]QSX32978.1 hypothetical protein JYB87_14715 [Shewanella avicenniae]
MQFTSNRQFAQRIPLGSAMFITCLILGGCTTVYPSGCSGPACAAVAVPLAIGTAAYKASVTRDRAADGCSKLTGNKQQQCYAQADALSESINSHRTQQ